jgi:hypothetical protein
VRRRFESCRGHQTCLFQPTRPPPPWSVHPHVMTGTPRRVVPVATLTCGGAFWPAGGRLPPGWMSGCGRHDELSRSASRPPSPVAAEPRDRGSPGPPEGPPRSQACGSILTSPAGQRTQHGIIRPWFRRRSNNKTCPRRAGRMLLCGVKRLGGRVGARWAGSFPRLRRWSKAAASASTPLRAP